MSKKRVGVNDDLIIELLSRGEYRVEPDGKVYSNKPGRFRNGRRVGSKNSYGYRTIYHHFPVDENGRRTGKKLLEHRMVWIALNGPISEGLEVNHRNGRKHENHPDNLELVTGHENLLHAVRIGLHKYGRGEQARFFRYSNEMVRGLKSMKEEGRSYKELERATGIQYTNIFRLIKSLDDRPSR